MKSMPQDDPVYQFIDKKRAGGKLRVWTGDGFRHVSFCTVVPFSATAGDVSPSSFHPVGAPLRGVTGRCPRSGRLGQNRKESETAYRSRLLFSGHRPLSDKQARTRSLLSERQSSPLLILVDLKGIEPSNLTDANRALSQLSYRPRYSTVIETALVLYQIFKKCKEAFLSFLQSVVELPMRRLAKAWSRSGSRLFP